MWEKQETKENADEHLARPVMEETKRTILIYSCDLNFSFSLSALFQDKFNVVTTTNSAMLEKFVANCQPDLVIVDADPSQSVVECLSILKGINKDLPIIALYVYSPKEIQLDNSIRTHVDSVFYKPLEVNAVSKRIEELLPG